MNSSLFDLSGNLALITGAHRGIGYAIAEELGYCGSAVAICSNDELGVMQAAENLKKKGIRAIGVRCDVGVDADLEAFVATAEDALGSISILVCNAGINVHPGTEGTATDEQFDTIMRVNLRSIVRLTALVAPKMVKAGGGAIILTSSITGLRGNLRSGVYGMSKAAVAQHARNLAVQLGPDDIRVNAISPGLIDTEFAKGVMADEERVRRRIERTPLRRVGRASDIAGVAVFLASPAASFITGQNIVVDGGVLISDH